MFWRRASEADRGQRVRLCWMTWYSCPRGPWGHGLTVFTWPVSVLSLILRVSCTGTVLSWFPQQVWTCLTMKPGATGSPLVSSGSETSYWQNWIRISVLYPPRGKLGAQTAKPEIIIKKKILKKNYEIKLKVAFLLQIRATTRRSLAFWTTAFWWPMLLACFSGMLFMIFNHLFAFLWVIKSIISSQRDIWRAAPSALLPELRHAHEWIVHLSVRPGLLLGNPLPAVLRLHPGSVSRIVLASVVSDFSLLSFACFGCISAGAHNQWCYQSDVSGTLDWLKMIPQQ